MAEQGKSGAGRKRAARKQTSSSAAQSTPPRPEELVAPNDETGTTVIRRVSGDLKEVTYAKVGDLAVFEGDIVLGKHTDLPPAGADADVAYGVGITGQQFRWPNALVPYEIDPAMPDQFRVTDALAHWVANTPIRFVQRTSANAGQYPNYVRFFAGGGCYSTVGMAGGRQDISLGSGCSTGNAIHEIGHTVGLWHEQSREDRNSFVTIMYANIDPSKVYNFDQHITDGDDIGAYDYGSIMHYPAYAFSANGQPTIVPVQAGATIGQRNGLSAGDIAAVNHMYPTVAHPPFKKVLDDRPPIFKKIRDDNFGNQFKKIRDDNIVVKPPFDPPIQTGLGQVVLPPFLQGGPVGQVGAGGDLPFVLATPHHAAAAAAYTGAAADPAADVVTTASVAAATAAQALVDLAAALQALGADGTR